MPTYEYICPTHGPFLNAGRADSMYCPQPQCPALSPRKWSFTVAQPFQPHHNPSTDTYIQSRADFQSQLSRATDEAQQRGLPTQLTPIDLMDKAACGVTNDGLDATYNTLKRQGRDSDAKRLAQLMDD